MQQPDVLLSIIIPTKNRYDCLIPVLKATLKYIYSDQLEIVVQDNSSDNKTMLDSLASFNDSRLKYFHHQSNLSVTDNTILGVKNANGAYLIFIGDDDLVSPYIIEIVKLMQERKVECLNYKPAHYWWNSVEFSDPNPFNQKCALWMLENISTNFQKLDAKKELQAVIQNGGVSYLKLPKFYHGVVKKEILENIKDKTGTYLPGGCPDISFAVSLALVTNHYHYIHFPVSVFGASKNSGGGMSANNTHFMLLDDATFVSKQTKDNWDIDIPKIWSAHTWNANSVQEVLKAFHINTRINLEGLYGSMLAYEKNLISYILPVMHNYCKGNWAKYCRIYWILWRKKAGIIYRKFQFEKGSTGFTLQIAQDVDTCMDILKKETNLFGSNS